MLRKAARAPPTPVASEDEIDPGLLDHIPDVEFPGHVARAEEPPAPTELQALLASLQHEMQGMLADGFARVEQSVADQFTDLEGRLTEAHVTIEELRAENAQLVHARDRYERAFQALKDLTRDIEETA